MFKINLKKIASKLISYINKRIKMIGVIDPRSNLSCDVKSSHSNNKSKSFYKDQIDCIKPGM